MPTLQLQLCNHGVIGVNRCITPCNQPALDQVPQTKALSSGLSAQPTHPLVREAAAVVVVRQQQHIHCCLWAEGRPQELQQNRLWQGGKGSITTQLVGICKPEFTASAITRYMVSQG